MTKEILPIICGPTSTGKTIFAIELAKKMNGELISADSRQVYKYLDIATNKGKYEFSHNINLNDLKDVFKLPVHKIENTYIHLISFVELDSRFSVYQFQKYTNLLIKDIFKRGKTPIIVGGTGLYIDSIVKGYNIPEIDITILDSFLEGESLESLHLMLKILDNNAFLNLNNSDKNNPRRLKMLIFKAGKPINKVVESGKKENYNFLMYYPRYNWNELREKIKLRVIKMFEEGLIEEVENILKMGFTEDLQALNTMGYREVVTYLKGVKDEANFKSMVEKIQNSNIKYARRQRTWFEGKNRNYYLQPF